MRAAEIDPLAAQRAGNCIVAATRWALEDGTRQGGQEHLAYALGSEAGWEFVLTSFPSTTSDSRVNLPVISSLSINLVLNSQGTFLRNHRMLTR